MSNFRDPIVKVNLGSGPTRALPTWVNLDCSINIWLSKHNRLKKLLFKINLIEEDTYRTKWPEYVRRWDVRRGLPFKPCTVNFIYTSHLLEHLTKVQAERLLKECYNALKPGGLIRIVVPDLRVWAQKYLESDTKFFNRAHLKGELPPDKFLRQVGLDEGSKNSVVSRIKEWIIGYQRHRWMWDYDLLSSSLKSCGFVDIEKKSHKKGKTPDIGVLDPDGLEIESLYVEARKPKSCLEI